MEKFIFQIRLRKKKRQIIIYGKNGSLNYDGYNTKNNFIKTKKKIFSKKKPFLTYTKYFRIFSSDNT